MIPLDDRGLLLGEGLFETVLAVGGVLHALEAHLDRLAAGCVTLGLPAPDRQEATALMVRAVAGVQAPRAAVRLTLTGGSGGRGLDRPDRPQLRLFATASPSARPETPARVVVSAVRRNDGSPASRLKTLAYLDNALARAEARERGADEAVMLNTRGEAACAAAANLFWLTGGVLFTPALECGVLAGVARAELIAGAERMGIAVREVRAGPDDILRADACFLTNSLIGLRPVSEFEDVGFSPSRLVESLRDLCA
jgi:branched-chain amino acid aminotransferase/4-amino-4-deoxychorismate lyase